MFDGSIWFLYWENNLKAALAWSLFTSIFPILLNCFAVYGAWWIKVFEKFFSFYISWSQQDFFWHFHLIFSVWHYWGIKHGWIIVWRKGVESETVPFAQPCSGVGSARACSSLSPIKLSSLSGALKLISGLKAATQWAGCSFSELMLLYGGLTPGLEKAQSVVTFTGFPTLPPLCVCPSSGQTPEWARAVKSSHRLSRYIHTWIHCSFLSLQSLWGPASVT